MSEMNGNMTMDTAEVVDAVKRDYSRLPKAEAASIHVDGNKGKKSDGQYTASAFVVMVKCNGEWRPENEWLHRYGMKCKARTYADSTAGGVLTKGIDKAKAAKHEILTKWGVAAETKAKKAKTTKADLEKMVADLQAKLAAMMAAAPVAAVS